MNSSESARRRKTDMPNHFTRHSKKKEHTRIREFEVYKDTAAVLVKAFEDCNNCTFTLYSDTGIPTEFAMQWEAENK